MPILNICIKCTKSHIRIVDIFNIARFDKMTCNYFRTLFLKLTFLDEITTIKVSLDMHSLLGGVLPLWKYRIFFVVLKILDSLKIGNVRRQDIFGALKFHSYKIEFYKKVPGARLNHPQKTRIFFSFSKVSSLG